MLGSLPGFNDTMMNEPVVPLWAVTANYSLTPTMFLEASIGHAQHDQAGCALNGGGANFCTAGFPSEPMSPAAPIRAWLDFRTCSRTRTSSTRATTSSKR